MEFLDKIRSKTLIIVKAGIILILFGGFLVNDSVDQTRTAALENIDAIDSDLQQAENASLIVVGEIDSANTTFYKFKSAFEKIGHAAEMAANGTEGMTNAMSRMGVFGQIIKPQLTSMGQSVNLIREAMIEMDEGVAEMENQTGEFYKLETSVSSLHEQIVEQRQSLAGTRKIVEDGFLKLKIANFVFVIAGILMFVVLLSNSVRK